MHTKPEITAEVVCILSLLKLRIKSVTMSKICRNLGFQMSAALYQVKINILKRIGIFMIIFMKQQFNFSIFNLLNF